MENPPAKPAGKIVERNLGRLDQAVPGKVGSIANAPAGAVADRSGSICVIFSILARDGCDRFLARVDSCAVRIFRGYSRLGCGAGDITGDICDLSLAAMHAISPLVCRTKETSKILSQYFEFQKWYSPPVPVSYIGGAGIATGGCSIISSWKIKKSALGSA